MKALTDFCSDLLFTFKDKNCPACNIAILLVNLIFVFAPTCIQADTVTEYKIKAAYLYQFSKFTHWPEQHKFSQDRFLICIYGKDPFGPTIKPIETKSINGLPIRLQHFTKYDEDMHSCRIVFFSKKNNLGNSILLELANNSVLTVGDYGDFIFFDGMIGFYIKNKRVYVTFNEPLAKEAHLEFDPRLLKLGKLEQRN